MSARKRLALSSSTTAEQVAAELNRIFEQVAYGHRKSRVWEEWLAYTRVVLETTLRPFRDGKPLDRTPLLEEEERLRVIFSSQPGGPEEALELFREATYLWYGFSEYTIEDVLGLTYMVHMLPNQDSGEFFTPWHVCRFMARLNIPDGAREVFDRIRQAVEQLREHDQLASMYAESVVLTAAAMAYGGESAQAEVVLSNLLPLIQPYYEPITVYDPACGSGGMLLAASMQFPGFANRLGLVQYFGQDIDQMCCTMARLNLMAYGLNGWGAAAVYVNLTAAGMPVPKLAQEEGELPADEIPEPFVELDHPAPVTPTAPFVLRPNDGEPGNQMAFGFLEEADVQ